MSIFDEIPDVLENGAFEVTLRVARYEDGVPAAYLAEIIPRVYTETSHRGFAIYRTPQAALQHALERHRTGEWAAPARHVPVLDLPVEEEAVDDLLDISTEDLLS